MKPIILLDINGVLNPKLHQGGSSDAPDPHLSDANVALVVIPKDVVNSVA